jgi:hypothetical protein
VVEDADDPRRTEPSFLAGERIMLGPRLEFHRATLLLKRGGVGSAGSAVGPLGTSELSIAAWCGNGRG